MRQLSMFIAAFVALLAGVTATLATVHERDLMLRGAVDATRNQDLPFIQPRLGVNVSLEQYSERELSSQLGRIARAGFTWVRQPFRWDDVEVAPGNFNWEPWDRIVAAIAREQLKPVAVLLNAPPHASGSEDPTAPPRLPPDFGEFAALFARRYGHVIDHYQIWDEPNLKDAWGQLDPEPVHYLAMLKAAWQAIHDADPGATVIAAALAPTTERGPRNISDVDYLRALYALGAADWMDAVAGKPYGFKTSPEDRVVSNDRLNFSRFIALREIMERHGDGRKALWASAWGWNSLPQDWSGEPSIWEEVTQAERIEWTLAATQRAQNEWPWLGGMILQHWQPDAPADDPLQGFTLINAANEDTSLYSALAQLPSPAAAVPGLHSVHSSWVSYAGPWSFGSDGADFGWAGESRAQFDFIGEDVALLVREGDYVAWFYVTVNGEPANALPKDVFGNAYLTLTSALRQPATSLVVVARNLGPGPHRLEIRGVDLVKEERQPLWALAGFAVGHGRPAERHERQIFAGSIGTLVSALATLVSLHGFCRRGLLRKIRSQLPKAAPGKEAVVAALASLVLMAGMLLTWSDSIPALFRRDALHPVPALLTAGLVFLQPGLILTVLALLLLFFLFFRRPALGLMLTLLWAPFYLFPLQLFQYAFPMSEVLVLLTSLAWFLRRLLRWARLQRNVHAPADETEQAPGVHALDLLMLAWLVAGVFAFSWSVLRDHALTELRVFFVEPALFYLIMRFEARDRRVCVLLADALLAAGLLVALIGLWLFLRGEAVITAEEGVRRLVSVYGSPNNAALFLGRCLPFALAWAICGPGGLRRWLSLLVFVCCSLALVLTQSAGALLLGLPLSLAAVVLLHWRRRALLSLTGLAAAAAASVPLLINSPRFARLLDFSDGTAHIRIKLWNSALGMLRENPWRGLGLDQFLYAYRDTWIMPTAWREPNLSHPHNILLDVWIRLGIAGPLVLATLLALFWRNALAAYRRIEDHAARVLLIGAMGSMTSLLAHGLVDNSVFVHDLVYVFVFLTGLVVNISQENRPSA